MSERPWMPLNIADYLTDTRHLTTLEHGAYLLLIMRYWQDGCLPQNEALIARYAGLTPEQWRESRDVLAAFFDASWHHKRIDAELARANRVLGQRGIHIDPGARTFIPVTVREAVFVRDHSACVYCGTEAGPFDLDHVTPWSRGGSDTEDNLVVACRRCNRSKGARTPQEWRSARQ